MVAQAGIDGLIQRINNGPMASTDKGTDLQSLVGKWLVEDIAGRGVVDVAQTTLEIDDDDATSGRTSVNRYRTKAIINGDEINIGPIAMTRRAGLPAMMDQESRFVSAMEKIVRYRVDANGTLSLVDAEGEHLLRCTRARSDEESSKRKQMNLHRHSIGTM